MKKTIISLLILTILTSFNSIKAYSITDNQIITAHEQTVYADSSQWAYKNNGWMCATPDMQQAYYNAWICTNGSWYYVNNYGRMVKDTWVNNYYVNSNGQWVIDAKRNPESHEIYGVD
jgi:glucan-binding YG repeat protein